MIQKIIPAANTANSVIRKNLVQTTSKLKNLAGSSMSGWHPPMFKPTEMLIPGGLSTTEKASYFLTGKLPQSVMKRWVHVEDAVPELGDQIVNVELADHYVGNILEAPHHIDIDHPDGVAEEALQEIDKWEIFKHLCGY